MKILNKILFILKYFLILCIYIFCKIEFKLLCLIEKIYSKRNIKIRDNKILSSYILVYIFCKFTINMLFYVDFLGATGHPDSLSKCSSLLYCVYFACVINYYEINLKYNIFNCILDTNLFLLLLVSQ